MLRHTLLLAALLAAPTAFAAALQPFVAHYEVLLEGKPRGGSTLRLERAGDGEWRYTVEAEGTRGLARLAAASARQATELALVDGWPQVRRTSAHDQTLLSSRTVVCELHPGRGTAQCHGDGLDPDQRDPLQLTARTITGHALNLALALEGTGAAPGATLQYDVLEKGEIKPTAYRVGAPEALRVPAGQFRAVPMVSRRPGKDRVTTVWFAPGLPPLPVRILRTDEGRPKLELRLTGWSPG